jgi:CRISPR-associated endonuclease/helicase Cas3
VELSNTKIILLTATQPSIFINESPLEILDNKKEYFLNPELDRIMFSFNKSKIRIKELVNLYKEKFNINDSFIFVLNTIIASIEVFDNIKEILVEKDLVITLNEENNTINLILTQIQNYPSKFLLMYLSSNIPLIERLNRVKILKKVNERNLKFILVSTQIIEAGIDIDAEIVIRDVAPLNNLIQVTGRCNRNKKRVSKGNVYINQVIDDTGKPYHEFIYDQQLIAITIQLFQKERKNEDEFLKERDLFNLIELYYEKISNYLAINKNLVDYLKKLKYSSNIKSSKISSIDQFHIINENYETESVILELDDKVKKIVNELEIKILERKNLKIDNQLKEILKITIEIKNIKRKLYDYSVDIPINQFNEIIKDITSNTAYNFNLLTKDKLKNYYNFETGFIKN